MNISKMAKMAQEFVVSTSRAVGNRTINIMDTNGIIIASSDPKRVGTFHQGAYEAVTTQQTVHIHSSDVQRYEGALEGCNTPIYYKGKIIGVVGIYGEPEEVADTAKLLNLYVTQFFEQNSINIRKQTEAEVRKQIMNLLFCQHGFYEGDMIRLEDSISVNLEMPCRIYIINPLAFDDKLKKLRRLDYLSDLLQQDKMINPQRDIYGIQDDCFIIIHTCNDITSCDDSYAQRLYNLCINELGDTELLVSTKCCEIGDIASAYLHACFMCRKVKGINILDKPIRQEQYLIHLMTMGKGKQIAQEYYSKLLKGLGESGFVTAIQTIEAYFSFEGSITKAASALHIHKNTLLYRINRIFTVAELESVGAFTRELLLKLVLDYYKYDKTHS